MHRTEAMNPLDLIVRNARVATASDIFDCDIGIAAGRIVALAQGLPTAAPKARRMSTTPST